MRTIVYTLLVLAGFLPLPAQIAGYKAPAWSMLAGLRENDSLCYYQGHVTALKLPEGAGKDTALNCTITDKFLLRKRGNDYLLTRYTATLQVFPNYRFSGLKIREKSYWGFAEKESRLLTERELSLLAALEKSGREAIEYDYPLTRHTRNQLIIKKGRDFKQLVIDGNWLISSLLAPE